MRPALEIRDLPNMGAREWDQIVAGYPSATVFHTSGWHESLNASLPGRVVRLEIRCRGSACGHWCGFLVSRFGLRLFGAPLPGTGTDYMYPLSIEPLETGQFLDALRAWAAQTRLSMVDIGGEYLDDDVLRSHGFRLRPTRTYRVDLAGGEAGVWARLKPAMRNKVRKAEKQGVVVDVDASSAFSPLFFEMLEAVFRRQNKVPTYSLRRIEAVVRGLQAAGAVVPLVAKLNGEALASVILLLDAKVGYYWGGASYESAYPVGANDLIQWRALQLCLGKGHSVYDTCGGGEYKEKFGGTLVSLPAGHMVLHPIAGVMRASVERGVRARQAVLGTLRRMTGSRA